MTTPKQWTDVYPQGTEEGNEEQKFFIALARNPKYDFRSIAAISKESGLTMERVEEIIQKYAPTNIVVQSTKNEDHWAYWERVGATNEDVPSISDRDKQKRIDEVAATIGALIAKKKP